MENKPSRRGFLKQSSAIGSAFALSALSYSRVYGANERLAIASIGTGGKGWSDLLGVAASPHVRVVALCDIDNSAKHLGQAAEKYAEAKQFADWRVLLDDSEGIDGVIVSTPDFMHAPIGLAAMHLGKHVFCQKPLTHTVFESRQMQLAAKKFAVVTQMGNQIQSHSAYRTAVKFVQDGLIGKVKAVYSWQGGSPTWPRAIDRPEGADEIPSHLHWDLWQGVAAERPFKRDMYHPFNWRGWQAFGTGQLGDFGCHILDPVFTALQLTAPTHFTAEAPALKPETWTDQATVRYSFPGTMFTAESTLPVTWYDSVGAKPPVEALLDLPKGYALPAAGSLLVGQKGTMLIPHVAEPKLFPEEKFPADQLETVPSVDHYVQWADACRGVGQTTSHFGYAGPLTETVILGTIGIRFPQQKLLWDSANLKITNADAAQAFVSKEYRRGWEPPTTV
jgi:predicted dehydrogenase